MVNLSKADLDFHTGRSVTGRPRGSLVRFASHLQKSSAVTSITTELHTTCRRLLLEVALMATSLHRAGHRKAACARSAVPAAAAEQLLINASP